MTWVSAAAYTDVYDHASLYDACITDLDVRVARAPSQKVYSITVPSKVQLHNVTIIRGYHCNCLVPATGDVCCKALI